MNRHVLIPLVAALVSGLASSGCNVLGPPAIANGRAVYNEVINTTEDEQVLGIILRERYDQTFGMLTVASVTANISARSSVGTNIGFGPNQNYDGNLVPLSMGFVYEENPTVSYVPLSGEIFYQRTLAPISLEHFYLMTRAAEDRTPLFRLMIQRINGIENHPPGRVVIVPEFAGLSQAVNRLHEDRVTNLVRVEGGEYYLDVHDYENHVDEVRTMLEGLGLDEIHEPQEGNSFLIPVRLSLGTDDDQLNFQTRSVMDVIRIIGESVEVPQAHYEQGIVERVKLEDPENAFLTIRSSPEPPEHALVATEFNGYWFYIDARDTKSKRGFVLLRTLIGMRVFDSSTRIQAPTLTIPVGG